jgi:hypothetical protein
VRVLADVARLPHNVVEAGDFKLGHVGWVLWKRHTSHVTRHTSHVTCSVIMSARVKGWPVSKSVKFLALMFSSSTASQE